MLLADLRDDHGILVVLQCLAEMGQQARPALPALRRIAEADERFLEGGILDEWIDRDEAIAAAATRAVQAIESDRE